MRANKNNAKKQPANTEAFLLSVITHPSSGVTDKVYRLTPLRTFTPHPGSLSSIFCKRFHEKISPFMPARSGMAFLETASVDNRELIFDLALKPPDMNSGAESMHGSVLLSNQSLPRGRSPRTWFIMRNVRSVFCYRDKLLW
jgi:hypothetical protein